jgi:hypothetical protein
MSRGYQHEQQVKAALELRGWQVSPFGHQVLPAHAREIVRRNDIGVDRVLWRWMPDFIASKGDRVYLVEVKAELRTDTDFFSIEQKALDAHKVANRLGFRVIVVFDDMTCNFSDYLTPHKKWTPMPGLRRLVNVNGSGTPFVLVRKADQHTFNMFFDRPETASRQVSA